MIQSLRSCFCPHYVLIGHTAYILTCYSLENMAINPEFISIVDTQNIPQFFDDILLGHPDHIDLRTQEQKWDTHQRWYHKCNLQGGLKILWENSKYERRF